MASVCSISLPRSSSNPNSLAVYASYDLSIFRFRSIKESTVTHDIRTTRMTTTRRSMAAEEGGGEGTAARLRRGRGLSSSTLRPRSIATRMTEKTARELVSLIASSAMLLASLPAQHCSSQSGGSSHVTCVGQITSINKKRRRRRSSRNLDGQFQQKHSNPGHGAHGSTNLVSELGLETVVEASRGGSSSHGGSGGTTEGCRLPVDEGRIVSLENTVGILSVPPSCSDFGALFPYWEICRKNKVKSTFGYLAKFWNM